MGRAQVERQLETPNKLEILLPISRLPLFGSSAITLSRSYMVVAIILFDGFYFDHWTVGLRTWQ